jgi:signal transduction histidine kinase
MNRNKDHKELLEAEIRRIEELDSYGILDTAPEVQFDQITELAALLTGASSAFIGLIDGKRQWFKSLYGFSGTSMSRDESFCNDTICGVDPVVIPDAAQHEKYKTYPAVVGDLKVRFYASVPVLSPKGSALGTICVFDNEARELNGMQVRALKILSEQVATLFDIRRATFELRANIISLGSAAEKVMEAEQVLREFCEITSARARGVDWKFKTLIEFGLRHLHLEVGFMGIFEKGGLGVHYRAGNLAPEVGHIFEVESDQIFKTESADEVVSINTMKKETGVASPLALELGFETWIATKIMNDTGVIGCLVFGAKSMRHLPLTPNDAAFVRVMAQWYGMVIDREARIKLVSHQQEVLRSSAQMAALGELAAGVAHEINNPLAVINTSVDLLRALVSSGPRTLADLQQPIERIEATVDRIHRIVKGLKFSSQNASRVDFAPIPVVRLLSDIAELTRVRFARSVVGLKMDKPREDLIIECRAVEIGQVLTNLINNAYDAAHSVPGGWVKCIVVEDSETVSFRVSDNGPGIPAEIQEKIMQPFFTTKEVGKGTGLGLSISKGIVAQHQGQLYLDTKSVQTCFVVTLPKVHPKA